MSKLQCIGRGTQGTVYKLCLSRPEAEGNAPLCCAAKVHSIAYVRFEAANIMPLSDPNLLNIIGFFSPTYLNYRIVPRLDPSILQEIRELQSAASSLGKGISFYDFMPRGSLDKCIVNLKFKRRISILKGIASGLLCLHQNGIVHLDLKPENVLLDVDFTPKIADFGCCINLRTCTLQEASQMTGSPRYRAPEVGKGPVDYKADVYSFGVLARELLPNHHGISKLAALCVSSNPLERPTMEQCCSRLAKYSIHKSECSSCL